MEERRLVEVHEAAVVVHLLVVLVLRRIEVVVAGHERAEASVPGLHHGPLLPDLHNVAEDEPRLGVAHPDLVTLHGFYQTLGTRAGQ